MMTDEAYYTSVQLGAKELLRKANAARLARAKDLGGKNRKNKHEGQLSATASSPSLATFLGLNDDASLISQDDSELPAIEAEKVKLAVLDAPARKAVSDRIALKIEASNLKNCADSEEIIITKNDRYEELPSIASVQRAVSSERRRVEETASLATLSIASQLQEEKACEERAKYSHHVVDVVKKKRAVPIKKTTAAEIYMEDQTVFYTAKERAAAADKERRRRETAGQFVLATPEMMKVEVLRFKFRDETQRELIWRNKAAELALLETRARESGVSIVIKSTVERHPMRLKIETLANAEISGAVNRALKVIESKGRLFLAARKVLLELTADWKKEHEEVVQPIIVEEEEEEVIVETVVVKRSPREAFRYARYAEPPRQALRLAPEEPPLPIIETLLSGFEMEIKGTHQSDPCILSKLWIHRRRRFDVDRGSWRPWRWRVTAYHLSTGETRQMTLPESSATAICSSKGAGTSPSECLDDLEFQAGEQRDDEMTVDAPGVKERAFAARLQQSASLVEGLRPSSRPEDVASRSKARLIAAEMVGLVRLESRRGSMDAFRAAAEQLFDEAAVDERYVTPVELARVLVRRGYDQNRLLGLPPLLFEEGSSTFSSDVTWGTTTTRSERDRTTRQRPDVGECLLNPLKVLRQVFVGMRGVVARAKDTADIKDRALDDEFTQQLLLRHQRRLRRRPQEEAAAVVEAAPPEDLAEAPAPSWSSTAEERFESERRLRGPPIGGNSTVEFGVASARWACSYDESARVYRRGLVDFLVSREEEARRHCRVPDQAGECARMVLIGLHARHIADPKHKLPWTSFTSEEEEEEEEGADLGEDDRLAGCEAGYSAIEGGGEADLDGCRGDGGSKWEAGSDTKLLLSMRVSDRAGETQCVPGCSLVGGPPEPGLWLGDAQKRKKKKKKKQHYTYTRTAGNFARSELRSSTQSVMASLVRAFDEAVLAPVITAWPIPYLVSPEPWQEPYRALIPRVTARSSLAVLQSSSDTSPMVKIVVCAVHAGILERRVELPFDGDLSRQSDGFRRFTPHSLEAFFLNSTSEEVVSLSVRPRALDAETAMRTYSFGLSERHMKKQQTKSCGVERMSVWHSTQRCVEVLVRQRNFREDEWQKDLLGIKLPMLPSPVGFTSHLRAPDEEHYDETRLTMFTKSAYDSLFESITQRLKREEQRLTIRARLEEIMLSAAYHDLAKKTTKRRMRAKTVRLISEKLAAAGSRGVGDSAAMWASRLERSTCVAVCGEPPKWEKRVINQNEVFYFNLDPLSDPPRLRWDHPPGLIFKAAVISDPAHLEHEQIVVDDHPPAVEEQIVDDHPLVSPVTQSQGQLVAFQDEATADSTEEKQLSRRQRQVAMEEKGRRSAMEVFSALTSSEGFIAELVERLGRRNVAEKTNSQQQRDDDLVKMEDEDAWHRVKREEDLDDREWWSDSDDEVGDIEEWEELFPEEALLLPQSHNDNRKLRLRREPPKVIEATTDLVIPPLLPFAKTAVAAHGGSIEPPAFGSEGWRQIEHHDRGRYWSRLPRASVSDGQFCKKPHIATRLSGNAPGWPREPQLPELHLVGLQKRSADDRSWGHQKATDWRPNFLPVAKLVKDPLDDVNQTMGAAARRSDLEGRLVTTDITLTELVNRDTQELTTVDEIILKDARDLAEGLQSSSPPIAELTARATFAARTGNLEQLEECIDAHKLSVEAQDDAGTALLALAAQQNDRRLCKYLLRQGADLNAANYQGNTALHFCFAYSYAPLGDYLIKKGADPQIQNADGNTCYEFKSALLLE